MPASPRKTGKLGALYIDLYDATHGAAQRIKIADVFNWELSEDVRIEDASIKGDATRRYKPITVSYAWRAERYVQGPSVFAREVIRHLQDPTPNFAAMGTTAAVDGGPMGTTTGLFGGDTVATAPYSGTAANKRPPVAFALYGIDTAAAGTLIAMAVPLATSVIISGQGYLIRGTFGAPRENTSQDTLEVQVDGDLTYAEAAP